MTPLAVIFDLDGTLLDTLEDLTGAINHVLTSRRLDPISPWACRNMVGNGARVLLQRAAGVTGPELDDALAKFLAFYDEHKFDHTTPYPGIAETLDALTARGLRLAVFSNKPHPSTTAMVSRLLGRWPFEHVYGQRDGVPLKPDPTIALKISADMNVAPGQIVFVGDSGEDMATAKAAGMFAVGVTWGLRDEPELHEHGADAVIHEPMRLLDVLEKNDPRRRSAIAR